MVNDTIRKIWKAENDPFLRFVDLESFIFRRPECVILQIFVKAKKIFFTMFVVNLNAP
jgi:hypothetical protein